MRFAREDCADALSWGQDAGGPSEGVLHVRENAAGKSTYARELAQIKNAVLLIQDEFLDALILVIFEYPGFRQVLRSSEGCVVSPHPRSVDPRGFSGPRLSWQHSSSAAMVSRDH